MAVEHPVQPIPWTGQLNEGTPPISLLEAALGHRFRDPTLLVLALTHAGHGHGRSGAIDNQRLEFLGDRVLGLVIAHTLIERFPAAHEGELGPRLTALVRREALAEVAQAIELGRFMTLAPADAAAGARHQPKLLADSCEAVIAALYLDGGLEAADRFIKRAWADLFRQVMALPVEPKTALQEWAQGRGKPLPTYSVVSSAGRAHAPEFSVRVAVEGVEPALATGPSKRAAEKAAATILLQRLGVIPSETEGSA
jgi:ribonuclease-3